jgi:hypothetical protein
MDGTIGLYVLTEGEAHRTHVAVLAGHGHSRRCHTKQESARNGGRDVRSYHRRTSEGGWGLLILHPESETYVIT